MIIRLSKALGRPVSGYSFMRLGSTWETPVARDWRAVDAAQRALRAKLVEKVPGAKVAVEHKRGGGVRAYIEHPNGERYVTEATDEGKDEGTWRVVGASGRKWEKVEGAAPATTLEPGPVKAEPEARTRRGALDDYRDVGEKIGRARKDLAAMRAKYDIDPTEAVTLDDLGEIETDPAYARTLVTRDRHFGTRSQQAETFKAQGMTAGAGYLTHRLVSAIGPKPEDSPTARRQYVQAADRMQKALDVLSGPRFIRLRSRHADRR